MTLTSNADPERGPWFLVTVDGRLPIAWDSSAVSSGMVQKLLGFGRLEGEAENIGGEVFFYHYHADVPFEGSQKEVFEVGDLVYWRAPEGSGRFGILAFYGNTTFGDGTAPRASSPGVRIGKIVADPEKIGRIPTGTPISIQGPDLGLGQVSFRSMDAGTKEDFALLQSIEELERPDLAGDVLALLTALANAPSVYQVNRLTHSLQCATRAMRDGADEELVVCALLHDVGDLHAPDNHAAFAATLLEPFVSEKNAWIVRHHGIFQQYYYFHHLGQDRNRRDAFRDHPWFADCEQFCHRWDQVSFDPHYDTLPLSTFEPLLRRVFSRPAWSQGSKSE